MSQAIKNRSVALVGRPNVGKSRLFNSLAGRRISIVHDMPGVTRDVITYETRDGYTLLDTGGIGMEPDATPEIIHAATEQQVQFAIEAAEIILFVVDAKDGITPVDENLAAAFRKLKREPVLLINKVDDPATRDNAVAEFSALGFGEMLTVSAEHKLGIDSIKRVIFDELGEAESAQAKEDRIRISLIGRPNVGKSSMTNALLREERVIVSEIPGTTRDAVELDLDFQSRSGEVWKFKLCDTAGLRAKTKVDSSVEYFSALRTEETIKRSDIVFLVIDAEEGVTRQEQKLAGMAQKWGKALIIVVNKWDLVFERFRNDPMPEYRSEQEFRKAYAEAVPDQLFFLPGTPVLFTSAKTGFSVEKLMRTARELNERLDKNIPTGRLNARIQELLEHRAPKMTHSKRFKIFYAVHVGRRPYKFRLFCNQEERLEDTYRRYLEKGLQETFDLQGCPVEFELMGKNKRYVEDLDEEEKPRPKPKKTYRRPKSRKRK